MEIKFIESHSFVGEHMTMEVNGNQHRLEMEKNIRTTRSKVIERHL
jgi:hypothetical protein